MAFPVPQQGVRFKDMKKPITIYIVGVVLGIYGIFTIKYSITGGAALPGIIAVIPLIGALGLFFKKSWARYFVHIFTISIVPWWIFSTIWLIWKKGWPYYPTTAQSIIGLVPGILLCLFCIFSSWVSQQFFSNQLDKET